jgi:catechol 2,3-dioxygenase-like lactoylglutathione lyase family enzyme
MVVRFTHVGICVADLPRARRFYCEGLGFTQVSELRISGEPAATLLQMPEVDLHAVYLERDGMRIELLHYIVPRCSVPESNARSLNQVGLTHLSMRVDDLHRTLGDLERVGAATIEHSRIAIPDFNAAAVFVRDPDGTLIELVQAPGDPALPPGA